MIENCGAQRSPGNAEEQFEEESSGWRWMNRHAPQRHFVKIIFREFLGFEPEWQSAAPNLRSMMQQADAALIIGDPAMSIAREQFRVL